jgi:hypothetical protein
VTVAKTDLAASILRTLQQLPAEKQAALKEFADFLQQQTPVQNQRSAARKRFISRFIDSPIKLPEFTPLTRDDLYRR